MVQTYAENDTIKMQYWDFTLIVLRRLSTFPFSIAFQPLWNQTNGKLGLYLLVQELTRNEVTEKAIIFEWATCKKRAWGFQTHLRNDKDEQWRERVKVTKVDQMNFSITPCFTTALPSLVGLSQVAAWRLGHPISDIQNNSHVEHAH